MLQLNKKGFAITTILYGILSVMILLLVSILAYLKNTKSLNTNFSSDIEKRLNNCVTDEIIIENCYASGSSTCDHTAYYSCIGIIEEVTQPGITNQTIREKLLTLVTTSGDGLYADNSETGRYIYRGTTVNNYINYSGESWRIISLEADGSAKIMLTNPYNTMAWDSLGTATDWKGTTLKNWLTNNVYSNISDKNKLLKTKPTWDVGIIYDTGTMTQSEIEQQVVATKFTGTIGTDGIVGLISATDYLKATLVNCSTNALKNSACTSWLSSSTMLIINGYKELFNEDINAGVIENGQLKSKEVTTSINFHPVVYLNNEVKISSGDGSSANPYKLE